MDFELIDHIEVNNTINLEGVVTASVKKSAFSEVQLQSLTGENLKLKVWGDEQSFKEGEVISATAYIKMYNDERQLNVGYLFFS